MTNGWGIGTLKTHWFLIFVFLAVGGFLSVGISFLRPLEYPASLKLDVTFLNSDQDVFSQAEMVQGIATDFSNAITTQDFYDAVIASNSDIDKTRLDFDAWNRAVDVHLIPNTHTLAIRALHADTAQAKLIVESLASIFSNASWRYTEMRDVQYEVTSETIIGSIPSRPNIFLNGFLGMLYGLFAAMGFIFIRSEQQNLRHRFIHEDF
ncbi:MAG: hypothetical protein WCT24_03760 [Patescibacteria group bacterium]|jgi:capsular polysaccharide biosynthesis protein